MQKVFVSIHRSLSLIQESPPAGQPLNMLTGGGCVANNTARNMAGSGRPGVIRNTHTENLHLLPTGRVQQKN